MRLIDADKLRFYLGSYFLIDPNELRFSQSCVFRMIDRMPTIEERKTGKWIKRALGWKCSNCNLCTNDRGADDFNFCPNCGADMRGEGQR